MCASQDGHRIGIEERAAVVALVRPGDVSWPEIADRIAAAGSALSLLREGVDEAGQGALFEIGDSSADLAEIDPRHRQALRPGPLRKQ